jgi:transcriptional regulator with XRE-family HTH domain
MSLAAKHELSARQRFAKNLRLRRLELGLSQEALADQAGLHRTYIGSIERAERNISIDSMARLAMALGLELVDLLRDERVRSTG